jgi:hypothetical protein
MLTLAQNAVRDFLDTRLKEQGVTNHLVDNLASSFGWLVPSMALVIIVAFLLSVLVINGFLT